MPPRLLARDKQKRGLVMNKIPAAVAEGALQPGECYLCDTPILKAHSGSQPDLFLRWNLIPLPVAAVDVVVHLHGFSRAGAGMPLAEKVARSGLDLSRRRRPTLAVLPRGNWLRYTWYDFAALLAGGVEQLIDYALAGLAAAFAGTVPQRDRTILTAHSGGGMPAIDLLEGMREPPDELHIFDGLYGRDPASGDPMRGLETVDRWLAGRLAGEPSRRGALRVVYIEQQTGPFSRRVGELIANRLAAFAASDLADLRRRYRTERSPIQHARIAERCGPDLLADAGIEFDWWR
jgi:hypothetical protein